MKIDIANFTIRPFEPTSLDYATVVKLINQHHPNYPTTVEILKRNDSKRDPKYLNRRYVGEIENLNNKQIVAVGIVNKRGLSNELGKYYIDFYIEKEFEDQRLGEPLYTHMVNDLADKNPVELKTEMLEDNAQKIELFQQKGFQQSRKPKPSSEFKVSNFDFDRFAGYAEKVKTSGIVIVNLQELETTDSNWMQKLYDMEIVSNKDKSGFKPMGLDAYAKIFERDDYLPSAFFVAVDGDNYVGISALWPNLVRKDLLSVGTTSVIPSHRRRGIATALKLKTIEFAQAYGASIIKTRNEENSPMYTLNMKLGFKPGTAWLTFEKVLG